ncbi:MAG: cell division protein ZapE [Proteobacteria bacterium]|nr:cell division protein ZapE [Pseudomonadota bacterium]
MGPLQRYQLDLESNAITADDAQRTLVGHLQNLYERIIQTESNRSGPLGRLKQWLFASEQAASPIQGLYIWGGVGRGKTYLMDVFFESLPGESKMRTHFHRFMQRVHRDLVSLQGQKNPLEHVADQIAAESRVLCFDEFFVRDIGDAMILAGLLEALFKRQVILIATSNIEPDRLYEDGLQRQRFLPAIESIKEHTQTVEIQSGVDYRLRSLAQATLYHCPITTDTEAKLMACFYELAPETSHVHKDAEIEILERRIGTQYCCDDVVWFAFEQICEGARSAFDYVELAKIYHAVILSGIPQMQDSASDSARRFISLVDELYDRRVKLVIAAEVPIAQLYIGEKLRFEFERAESRLIEMQSEAYLGDQHLA